MDEQKRRKILSILEAHRIMTIATLRADGWPQATTVGFANEGLNLYFLCGLDSQKARNIARDNRVSITVDHDSSEVMEITGLSMAARCEPVLDRAEGERIMRLLVARYSPQKLPTPELPKPEEVRLFRVKPEVISVVDYAQGFGHTDLVTVNA